MKLIYYLLILICCISQAKEKNTKKKINLISSQDKIELTQELNQYSNLLYLNEAIEIPINSWDIGFQIQNIPLINGNIQNFEYDAYLSISNTFNITENFSIQLGEMGGILLTGKGKFQNFSYLDIEHKVLPDLSIHYGIGYVNMALSGSSQNLVGITGIDWQFHQLHFSGDYWSGHNNLSSAQLSIGYEFSKVEPYLGIIIPETNSGNEFVGIIGTMIKF